MRILVLTTWYPSVDDPVRAVFVRRHVEAIASRHDVSVVHFAAPGVEFEAPSSRTLHMEHSDWALTKPDAVASALRHTRAKVRHTQPDIVHTMGFSSLALGAAAHVGLPWVHTEHWSGVTEPQSVGPVWSALRPARHLLRLPSAVTTVSSDMARQVAPFARRGRVSVVGNVVEPAPQVPQPAVDEVRLLAVGGLNPIKDPELAVRVVGELHARGFAASMRWAGSGPLLENAQDLSSRLGVADHVEWLGQVPPEQLGGHFGWSSQFLLPTKHETFCVAAAEALAHGRPVVVGAKGGQRDFVSSANGALVGSRDPRVWADHVLDVHARFRLTPPETLSEPIKSKFSPVSVARAFDDVYGTLLSAHDARSD